MLSVPDCVAYWKAPAVDGSAVDRYRVAFDRHWFGTKSEARVKTLLGDMALRFDAYPLALEALRAWVPPSDVAPWLCHFHTQLADPIYRRFSGGYLPRRREQGYANVDREVVARWVEEQWPGRWSPITSTKFGSNLLASAFEAGLLRERKDPRRLVLPRVPALAFEYLLYLLREVSVEGRLLESPYVRSVAPDEASRAEALRSLGTVHLDALGDVQNISWDYPDLLAWARAQRVSARSGHSARLEGSAP